MAGQASGNCVVQTRELGIPLLAASSTIHADPHEASDARQSQGGP
jgi:hypothetical protein